MPEISSSGLRSQSGRTDSLSGKAASSSLHVSGAADRFYRVRTSRSSTIPLSTSQDMDTEPSSTSTAPLMEESAAATVISPPNSGNAPDMQLIDRAAGGLPKIASSGFHMPPEILGQDESAAHNNNEDMNQSYSSRRPAALVDLNKSVRKRSNQAVKATKSKAATAAAVKSVALSSSAAETSNLTLDSSMFTFLVYKGMEVIFSNTSHNSVVGVCSRTNYVFQQLNLASTAPIVSITSNCTSGLLVVAHQDGFIRTYTPMETDPVNLKSEMWKRLKKQQPKSVYGRFRWIDGTTIDVTDIFYKSGDKATFRDRRQAIPGELLDISSSYDFKLLVAHRQQLAVFDVAPSSTNSVNLRNFVGKNIALDELSKGNNATLLWTTLLPSKIVTAKISGDGQAVVVVLDQPQNDDHHGALTFLHDKEDGSQAASESGQPDTIKRSPSIGMVYKPGPFLHHSKPVSRISFRGFGHLTPAANPEETPGNDLLMTYCEADSTVRIFNQNEWRQLLLWTAAPNSRADWILGSSSFNLGDLEPNKKSGINRMLRPGSRRPSQNSSELSNASGGINSGLRNHVPNSGSGVPSSAAGAWIAEVTFRGAYPALRLSRLSYMKRGNDESQAAHFESVAAILPAGSIVGGSVLNSDDMGISVQGIWPAWNPWLSEHSGKVTNDTLSGSAMQFLGLSSGTPTSTGVYGESFVGGTHGPPTELRIVSSHPKAGHVVLMEFPLWGDEDFGAMELGSPIRTVMAMSEISSIQKRPLNPDVSDSMDYENSRLCAKTATDGRSISLLWRKEGSTALFGTHWLDENSAMATNAFEVAAPTAPDLLVDLSVIPVPLALPPLRLPRGDASVNNETIAAVRWWPDDSFGAPPLLVAITKSATLLVYEIPPPRFALEPAMPNFDSMTAQSSVASGCHDENERSVAETGSDDDESSVARQEYDVLVTPHPDFGLGLRLESPMDGLPAIAGSFKKNPLNDGMLPAEKSGMICLGDELLSVNGVTLENMTFDDIIATVRHVGTQAGPGEPLKMKFRPVPSGRSRKNSAVVQESFSARMADTYTDQEKNLDSSYHRASETASLAAAFFKGSAETQQEFGRVLAVVRRAVTDVDVEGFAERFLVLPWKNNEIQGNKIRAAALMVHVCQGKIEVSRLELPSKSGLDRARKVILGVVDVVKLENNADQNGTLIRSIKCIENSWKRSCLMISDSSGGVHLLYLHFGASSNKGAHGSELMMSHKIYKVIHNESDLLTFKFQASSPGVIAAMRTDENPRLSIKIWHSRLDSSSRILSADGAINDEYFGRDYSDSTIFVEPSESSSELDGFCFLETGCLDSFPTIVALLTSEAVVYQRRGGKNKWLPVLRLSYPALSFSYPKYDLVESCGRLVHESALDSYPHILHSLRNALSSYDEKNCLVSDWHPESLLSHICMEPKGARIALEGDVRRLFLWLADKIDDSPEDNLSTDVPLLVTPFTVWGVQSSDDRDKTPNDGAEFAENSPSLMSSTTLGSSSTKEGALDMAGKKLQRLYAAMSLHLSDSDEHPHQKKSDALRGANMPEIGSVPEYVDVLPAILSALGPSKLRLLKGLLALVIRPPEYGELDPQSQLSLTLFELHQKLKEESSEKQFPSPRSASLANYSGFCLKRNTSRMDTPPKLPPQSSSAGCLAALLSDYQEILINTIHVPGGKLDWALVRDMRLPFWVRSDERLKQISEEVGRKMYRDSRDILQSAIFFIVAGKQRTLVNLAAADNTDSGRKFYKFLTSYDFSTERGRLAAEKNAFSLLRKNRYDSASAFFLLPQPPILKSAIETIATKMEDLDLAFLVSRLVGNSWNTNGQIGNFGSLGAYGGVLGGGGGYAAQGMPLRETKRDREGFRDWKRQLCPAAKQLLLDRCLPASSQDSCFSAVQLMWLGRGDEASHWLTGMIGCPDGTIPRFMEDVTVPLMRSPSVRLQNNMDANIFSMNAFINLASGPFLLRRMNANQRTTDAAVLAISRALASIGIEITAIKSLTLSNGDGPGNIQPSAGVDPSPRITNGASIKQRENSRFPSTMSAESSTDYTQNDIISSVFDAFDVAPKAKPNTQHPSSGDMMKSNIFDSFDVPPSTKGPVKSTDAQIESPIFDSFDTTPISRQTLSALAPSDQSGKSTSSIFDLFDVSTAPKAEVEPTASGKIISSIFDSFETVPPLAPRQIPEVSRTSSTSVTGAVDADVEKAEFCETSLIRQSPELWSEWREDILLDASAKRLIRELSTLCAPYHCDRFEHGLLRSAVVSNGASMVLQFHCDGDALMTDVANILETVSAFAGLNARVLVEHSVRLLHSPHQFYRTLYVVLLLLAVKEVELAEDVIRHTSQSLIEYCTAKAFSNDHIAAGRHCIAHLTHLSAQKVAAHASWQLELCLWIHRGGALPLSGLSLNEAICAIRIGFLVASWSRDFETQETLVRQPPDCLVDEGAGRQLWSSLKIITGRSSAEKKVTGTGSGGWEFLVDCRRSEATDLLRSRPTGCFIIRPHQEDHGVFTLSFKTNLIPTQESNGGSDPNSSTETGSKDANLSDMKTPARPIRKDDVVQHAIIRLSDSGFRCGSFGPFGTLMKLLGAVSASLPFDLRFDMPPTEGIIKDEGSKPSPNSVFLRKLAMHQAEFSNKAQQVMIAEMKPSAEGMDSLEEQTKDHNAVKEQERRENFGLFLELLLLSELRKQLSAVAAAEYDSVEWIDEMTDDVDSVGSLSDVSVEAGVEQQYAIASRVLRPYLTWCRVIEVGIVDLLAPLVTEVATLPRFPISLKESETAIEISATELSRSTDGNDGIVRRMIQPGSGVEFRTLRLGEGGESAMVVLFSKKEAVAWFLHNEVETDEDAALERLRLMEHIRVIEPVDLKLLAPKAYKKGQMTEGEEVVKSDESTTESGIRYRLVDPWEVEPLGSREAETRGASLGRQHLLAFGLGRVASSCEELFRSIGGFHLLELWAATKGGILLTKALATVHAPWERASGGDLLLIDGIISEPSEYENSIREHLYRNSLYRNLKLPQRFVALIQVELLDLKNLTSPGGSLSLTVYSLLRLKRSRSSAPLTSKARTLDSVATPPVKLAKTSGPNAPASWGSLVRFRYPLPENTAGDGTSFDRDCEALFKGPPSVLQVSVYEKKFMSDSFLGGADVKLDGLDSGGQLEEWVPLKTETHGIHWFARIRLTLRFELMCLAPENESPETLGELAPSVGLRRIQQLCSVGGAQMDLKKSVSTPDILSYFESMVY